MQSNLLVRWGIMGCANIAISQVIPAILEATTAVLHAVASRSPEKAKQIAEKFGAPNAYGSYQELLYYPEVDAIYIPLPNSFHKTWAIAAVRAGKHVLCEKPIALNAAEAREMQHEAKKHGRLLLEAFMYSYAPVVQKATALIREGQIGEIRAVHSMFTYSLTPDPRNIRLQSALGGGALYDAGCYCLDV